MNYQELRDLIGGSNPQAVSYEDIISGIQSQYRPQTQFAPTRSLLDMIGNQLPDQQRIAYGSLLQAQPRVLPEPFDISKYLTKTTDDTTTDTTTRESGGGGDAGGDAAGPSSSGGTTGGTTGSAGFSIDANGLAVPDTVNQGLATVLGLALNAPLGMIASITNSANTAAANAANAAISQADVDSIATTGNTATAGATGTGAAAAAAGTAAAAAATANGASPAAAAAAGQAAANATVSGAPPSVAAAIGAAAAVSTDGGNSSSSTDGPAGAAVSGEAGWARGGLVTMNRLRGPNPMGQDEGYGALQSGEYVIKKNAVDKYGEEFLGLLNSGKLTKKQIKSLL
jgi:hypothetical protein